jgi:hypothetical protein
MLENDPRSEPLLVLSLLILKVEGLDDEISGLIDHMLLAVRKLVFARVLAGSR